MIPVSVTTHSIRTLLFCSMVCCAAGRSTSIDEFGKGLDMSILDENPTDSQEPETPALHLFSGFEESPTVKQPEIEDGVTEMLLKKTTILVVPNAPRIDEAYRQLGKVMNSKQITPQFPLKVILHADGNVSVGCGMKETIQTALPPGTDISPQAAIKLMGVGADVQLAERSHPPVVDAVVRIRAAAKKTGATLDTSEIFFLPLEPGKVWVGLRVKEQEARP